MSRLIWWEGLSGLKLWFWLLLDSCYRWHCWMELLELSYQAILLTWRRVLLSQTYCPHEVKCVNSQVDCLSAHQLRHTLWIGAVLKTVAWTPLCHDMYCHAVATITSKCRTCAEHFKYPAAIITKGFECIYTAIKKIPSKKWQGCRNEKSKTSFRMEEYLEFYMHSYIPQAIYMYVITILCGM